MIASSMTYYRAEIICVSAYTSKWRQGSWHLICYRQLDSACVWPFLVEPDLTPAMALEVLGVVHRKPFHVAA